MTWNDYMKEHGAEEYGLALGTPEPLPVMISCTRCPIHNFHYVSMPRNAGENYHGPLEKCPIKSCDHSG